MKLIKYRDSGSGNSYTWFWVSEANENVGPYFDSEEEARLWASNLNMEVVDERT